MMECCSDGTSCRGLECVAWSSCCLHCTPTRSNHPSATALSSGARASADSWCRATRANSKTMRVRAPSRMATSEVASFKWFSREATSRSRRRLSRCRAPAGAKKRGGTDGSSVRRGRRSGAVEQGHEADEVRALAYWRGLRCLRAALARHCEGHGVGVQCEYEVSVNTRLIRIGNSRGIRLPKPVIEEAGLKEHVQLQVRSGAVVISSLPMPRAGWAKMCSSTSQPRRGSTRRIGVGGSSGSSRRRLSGQPQPHSQRRNRERPAMSCSTRSELWTKSGWSSVSVPCRVPRSDRRWWCSVRCSQGRVGAG